MCKKSFMKYFIIVSIVISILITFCFPLNEVSAKESRINTGTILIDELNSTNSPLKQRLILESSTQKAKSEADEIIQNEFLNLLSSKEFSLSSDERYKEETFKTESNVEIKVVLSDVAEDGNGNVLPQTRAFTGYKDYGDRRYTIECYAQHPKGRMNLKVVNRYTISKTGLVVRKPPHKYPTYLETSNTYYIKKKKTSLTYPISSISKVNKYLQINGAVFYKTTTDVGIESKKLWGLHANTKIKLLEWDKTNKRAKVDERSFIGRSEQ